MKNTASKNDRVVETSWKCHGGCGAEVMQTSGTLAFCFTCWWVGRALVSESCETIEQLRLRRERADFYKARISDLLRRTGVEDAEELVDALSGI